MNTNNALLVSTDNISAASNYYPSSAGIEMGLHTVATVGIVVSGGVTVTVEACMRQLGRPSDAYLSDVWVDITKQFYDLATGASGTASFADASKILQANGLNVERIRIKAVTADGTNSLEIWLRRL